MYNRYSGYPGGRRETSVKEFIAKKGRAELLRKVILGMLPRNRQRSRIIKRLTVKD
jgi:ribosomal protein L13